MQTSVKPSDINYVISLLDFHNNVLKVLNDDDRGTIYYIIEHTEVSDSNMIIFNKIHGLIPNEYTEIKDLISSKLKVFTSSFVKSEDTSEQNNLMAGWKIVLDEPTPMMRSLPVTQGEISNAVYDCVRPQLSDTIQNKLSDSNDVDIVEDVVYPGSSDTNENNNYSHDDPRYVLRNAHKFTMEELAKIAKTNKIYTTYEANVVLGFYLPLHRTWIHKINPSRVVIGMLIGIPYDVIMARKDSDEDIPEHIMKILKKYSTNDYSRRELLVSLATTKIDISPIIQNYVIAELGMKDLIFLKSWLIDVEEESAFVLRDLLGNTDGQ